MLRLFPLFKTVSRNKTLDPVDKIFSDFSNELFRCEAVVSDQTGSFKVDIKESPEAYWLLAELPGYSQEEISIEYKGSFLSIVAKKTDALVLDNEEESTYLRKERVYNRLSRSFKIDHIDGEALSVNLDKGLLTLKIPKLYI